MTIQKPKIEIKGYKSCRGNEGDAFSCTMYVDGKKAALVRYDGWGGPFSYDFTVAGKGHRMMSGPVYDRLAAYVDSLPEEECGFTDPATGKPATIRPNLDMVVERAVGDMLEEKQLRRWCRTKVVFRVEGDGVGEYRTLGVKFEGNEAQVRAQLARTYGDKFEIINERFAA